MHVMIFGAGYSGKAIANAMPEAARLSGTTRSVEKMAALTEHRIEPFLFDGNAMSDALLSELKSVTHLVQSIAPDAHGDPLLKLISDCVGKSGLKTLMPKLVWTAYLSTVGVYGDHDGAWVDETSECRPVSARSRQRVMAEEQWMAACTAAGLPLAILRLSGIYGPGRNTFRNIEKGTARRLVKKDQVFNRIRLEDIGAATRFLVDRMADGIFNVTDDEPAPPQDVVMEACRIAGVEPPPEQDFETAELTPMARSFYGENKRVSNRKIRGMGFSFQFPDYRTSLADLWRAENRR
ncbi:SDR family oxidoreductase [Rhizobium sp. PAMB 3174]